MRTIEFVWTICIAISAAACGAYDPDAELGDPSSEEDAELAEFSQALNSSGTCPTAAANRTFTGSLPYPSETTPSTYGASGCGNAYFVNINDLTTLPTDGFSYRDFILPGAMATSRSVCERTRLMVYVWERRTSSTVFLGAQNQWGGWVDTPTGDFCFLQTDLVVEFDLVAGRDYHIAASSRRYDTAGDSGSAYSTKTLRLSGPYEP